MFSFTFRRPLWPNLEPDVGFHEVMMIMVTGHGMCNPRSTRSPNESQRLFGTDLGLGVRQLPVEAYNAGDDAQERLLRERHEVVQVGAV